MHWWQHCFRQHLVGLVMPFGSIITWRTPLFAWALLKVWIQASHECTKPLVARCRPGCKICSWNWKLLYVRWATTTVLATAIILFHENMQCDPFRGWKNAHRGGCAHRPCTVSPRPNARTFHDSYAYIFDVLCTTVSTKSYREPNSPKLNWMYHMYFQSKIKY